MSYTVEVTREGDAWIADVVDLPGAHTYARNLTALDAAVREVIRLVLDIEEGETPELLYNYKNVDDAFLEAAAIGRERADLDARQQSLVAQSADLARRLTRAGWSVRDISGVLRISPGRVSQVVGSREVSANREL